MFESAPVQNTFVISPTSWLGARLRSARIDQVHEDSGAHVTISPRRRCLETRGDFPVIGPPAADPQTMTRTHWTICCASARHHSVKEAVATWSNCPAGHAAPFMLVRWSLPGKSAPRKYPKDGHGKD